MSTNRRLFLPLGAVAAALIILALPTASAAGDEPTAGTSAGTLLSAGQSGYPDIPRRGPRYLFPKNREYKFLSVQVGPRSMDGGRFDGEHVFATDTELSLIPDLDDAVAIGAYLEFRQAWWGGAIGYSYASHDWDYLGESTDGLKASSHFLDFNFQGYLLADRNVQPFGLLGFSFNGIRVEEAKYGLYSGSVSDASMWGFGLNWGAGVDFYPTPQFKVTAGARWFWTEFNRISGENSDDGLSCDGLNYYVSVGFGIG